MNSGSETDHVRNSQVIDELELTFRHRASCR